MTVTLNGAPYELPAGLTVQALLERLGVGPDGVAVAVDGRVVPRSAHPTTALRDGARVDVVRAVGGG